MALRILRPFIKSHAHPRGLLGRLAAWHMLHENREANRWMLELLAISPTDHVLEVGFGPGDAIRKAAALAPHGLIVGVDASDTMLALARRRNRRAIAAGLVDVRLGDAAALPFDAESFDKAFGVNLVYFLPDPAACARELWRVLRAGGTVGLYVVGSEYLARWSSLIAGIYTLLDEERLASVLRAAGFGSVRIEARAFAWGRGVCALKTK